METHCARHSRLRLHSLHLWKTETHPASLFVSERQFRRMLSMEKEKTDQNLLSTLFTCDFTVFSLIARRRENNKDVSALTPPTLNS